MGTYTRKNEREGERDFNILIKKKKILFSILLTQTNHNCIYINYGPEYLNLLINELSDQFHNFINVTLNHRECFEHRAISALCF